MNCWMEVMACSLLCLWWVGCRYSRIRGAGLAGYLPVLACSALRARDMGDEKDNWLGESSICRGWQSGSASGKTTPPERSRNEKFHGYQRAILNPRLDILIDTTLLVNGSDDRTSLGLV
jgi:hypothetical protein